VRARTTTGALKGRPSKPRRSSPQAPRGQCRNSRLRLPSKTCAAVPGRGVGLKWLRGPVWGVAPPDFRDSDLASPAEGPGSGGPQTSRVAGSRRSGGAAGGGVKVFAPTKHESRHSGGLRASIWVRTDRTEERPVQGTSSPRSQAFVHGSQPESPHVAGNPRAAMRAVLRPNTAARLRAFALGTRDKGGEQLPNPVLPDGWMAHRHLAVHLVAVSVSLLIAVEVASLGQVVYHSEGRSIRDAHVVGQVPDSNDGIARHADESNAVVREQRPGRGHTPSVLPVTSCEKILTRRAIHPYREGLMRGLGVVLGFPLDKTIKAATHQTHEDHDIDAEADLEQGLMFAIECGEVEGLKMPVSVRTFEDAGIRTPRRGLVVGDAGGREFRLTIVRSDETPSDGT
jgi:hypothetical protein